MSQPGQNVIKIARSRRALYGSLGVCAAVILIAMLDDGPTWERGLFAAGAGVALLVLASRLGTATATVLSLSPSGLHDTRLDPEFIPWAQVRSAYFEPTYFRGGAIVLALSGPPVPEVRPQLIRPALNEEAPQVEGLFVRLPLTGYKYDRDAIKARLADSVSTQAAAV